MQNKLERPLVDAAVGGDVESFGELCQRYYSPMVAIAYSVLRDRQLAEDAAQESFARALIGLRNLKNRTRFAPWLAGICRNVAKDMVASKVRQTSSVYLSPAVPGDSHNENRRLIRRAIKHLPAAARELIILRYYNNLSYEEMASVTGISHAAINGRLARAKRKMAKYLTHNGFPENPS